MIKYIWSGRFIINLCMLQLTILQDWFSQEFINAFKMVYPKKRSFFFLKTIQLVSFANETVPMPLVVLLRDRIFKECVTFKLQFQKGIILLNMITLAQDASFSFLFHQKVQPILLILFWVTLYDRVEQFGGENSDSFINCELMAFCKALRINIYTAGVESPCYNGSFEKQKFAL